MSRDDLPELPARPPRKQRELERVPDVWLRLWLSAELARGDRLRVEHEIDRRKRAVPDVKVGVLVGREGVTPPQFVALGDQIRAAGATEIHHPGVSGPLHTACRALGVPVVAHRAGDDDTRMREVVKEATTVIAAPRETVEPLHKAGVWGMAKYAKHRSLPVTIVLPNGTVR